MRILMAIDGSRDSTAAVEWLLRFPLPTDATVDIVCAFSMPLIEERSTSTAWQEMRKEAASVVENARHRCETRWSRVSTRLVEGDPRDTLVDIATTSGSDLVVAGARGLGAIASALLGSVSLYFARYAPCPVLICKGTPRQLSTVTIGLDGSDSAHTALEYLCDLPVSEDLALHLVGVVELRYSPNALERSVSPIMAVLKQYEDEQRRQLDQVLQTAARKLRTKLRTITTRTPVGAAAAIIVREAEEQNSDLIVVGARGLGSVKRLLLGSVSESVLRHAHCSVLIVRRSAVP